MDTIEELIVKQLAKHQEIRVIDHAVNPTLQADVINASLPEAAQFPPTGTEVPTSYGMEVVFNEVPYIVPQVGYELIRCKRAKYHYLSDAQSFFDRKRQELKWSVEAPIYRTAIWWCKRIWK